MAVHSERVVGRRLHEKAQQLDHSRPSATGPGMKRARGWPLLRNRAIWILSGILLGAAAGWTVFRTFLVLVTLD